MPGLEGLDPVAGRVDVGLAERVLVLGAGDEGRKAGLDLLPHQLGVVIVVEIAELQDHGCKPRHAPDLSRPQALVEMQHLGCRDRLRHQRLPRLSPGWVGNSQ